MAALLLLLGLVRVSYELFMVWPSGPHPTALLKLQRPPCLVGALLIFCFHTRYNMDTDRKKFPFGGSDAGLSLSLSLSFSLCLSVFLSPFLFLTLTMAFFLKLQFQPVGCVWWFNMSIQREGGLVVVYTCNIHTHKHIHAHMKTHTYTLFLIPHLNIIITFFTSRTSSFQRTKKMRFSKVRLLSKNEFILKIWSDNNSIRLLCYSVSFQIAKIIL